MGSAPLAIPHDRQVSYALQIADMIPTGQPRAIESQTAGLPPELEEALQRLLEKASDSPGRATARVVIFREAAIWTKVQAMLEEERRGAPQRPAFDALWTAIRGDVRSTIRAALMRKDDDEVDEVEQRAAIEVLRKLGEYSIERGTFLIWVRGIARNLARWKKAPVAAEPVKDTELRPDQDRQLPPSRCFRELLSCVQQKEVHHATVFLLHEYLGWSLGRIAELGNRTVTDLVGLTVKQITEEVVGLKEPERLFGGLRLHAEELGGTTLAELYGTETPEAALSHWSGDVKRWMRKAVIGGGGKLLKCVSQLRAGAHERLTFLWSRFLRRTLVEMSLSANKTLEALLTEFRSQFPKLSDLDQSEVERSTEPLHKDIVPQKTLAQCSRSELAQDLVVWRERVQMMVSANCAGGITVAYAYMCGGLPGISGPAKGGVA